MSPIPPVLAAAVLSVPAFAQCNPVFVASYPMPLASRIHIQGATAFVTNPGYDLYLIDISDPSTPTLIGRVDPASESRDVDVEGGLALLAGGFSVEAECISLANPAAPTRLGMLDTPGVHWSGNDVEIMGSLAYVAAANHTAPPDAIRVIDLSNPAAPTVINTVNTPGEPQRFFRDGTRLYVADGGSGTGLLIYDLADPVHPTLLGRYTGAGFAHDVEVVGNFAYLSDFENGMKIIDVSNPASPTRVGSISFTYLTYGLTVSRGVAYIANWGNGLRIVNVANPAAPSLIRTIDLSDIPLDAEVRGNHLFVAWRQLGLRIYDIASCGLSPCNPADFAEPFGTLDLADITGFVSAFSAGEPSADLAPPAGLFDLSDVVVFVQAFLAGC
jgi:hypothetical protein